MPLWGLKLPKYHDQGSRGVSNKSLAIQSLAFMCGGSSTIPPTFTHLTSTPHHPYPPSSSCFSQCPLKISDLAHLESHLPHNHLKDPDFSLMSSSAYSRHFFFPGTPYTFLSAQLPSLPGPPQMPLVPRTPPGTTLQSGWFPSDCLRHSKLYGCQVMFSLVFYFHGFVLFAHYFIVYLSPKRI